MNTKDIPDFELVSRFVEGDQSCMEVLINRHKSRVYSYIYITVRNSHLAEDLFQDTFVKVIKSLKKGRYQEQGIFVSWVMRIAHNLIIDHYRREKNLQTCSSDASEKDLFNTPKFSPTTIEEDIIQNQITGDVRRLIDELPHDQREVVLLREIAQQTNVSINTALGRMRYALINMRRIIEERKMNLTIM